MRTHVQVVMSFPVLEGSEVYAAYVVSNANVLLYLALFACCWLQTVNLPSCCCTLWKLAFFLVCTTPNNYAWCVLHGGLAWTDENY